MDIDRAIDRATFAVVLCLPLLPAGPAYLGFEPRPWLHAAVLLLLVLSTFSTAHRRFRTAPADGEHRPPLLDPVGASWAVFVAAAIGATLVGLAAENDLGSPLFRYHLQEAWRLLWPMDRVWDPLYPLQIGVVFIEGLLTYLAVRALCLQAGDPQRRARAVVRGWTYGFGIVGAFAVFQHLTRFRLHPFWVEVNPELTRSHATLDDPNALGSYLALGIPLCLGLAAASRNRRAKVAVALAMLGTFGLLASGSRAAIGGLLLAGLTVAALPRAASDRESAARAHVRRGARWLLVAGAALLAASMVVRLVVDLEPLPYRPGSVGSALMSVLDPRIPTAELLEHRGVWWSAASRMAGDAPVLGVGLGRFPRLLPAYAAAGAGDLDTHNLFLQILAEMGVVGLLAFGALLGGILSSLASLRRASSCPGTRLVDGALLGSAAYIATFVTGHPLLVSSGQALWATMLAAVVVLAGSGAHAGAHRTPGQQQDGTGRASGACAPPRLDSSMWRACIASLCFGIIAIYTVDAFHSPPAAAHRQWGYSYGLYAQEIGADGRPFRWTDGLALLQLRAPPDATALRVELTVAPASRSGQPTRVRISLDRNGSGSNAPDRRDFNVRRVANPTSYAVSLRLAEDHRFGDDVFVRVEVAPTFVPARQGPSDDRRELGVRLFPPTFLGGDH